MAESKRFSETLDQYFDRSRKTISQWVSSHISSELSKVNGNITVPIKKPLQDIFDYVLLDAHLSSVIQQRTSKVLSEEFAVFDSNGNIDDELTKLLSKKWFSKIQSAIIDSKLYGYNLIEVQELVENEIRDIKVISRGNVIPELRCIVKNPFQVTLGSLIPLDNRNDSDYYILIDSETTGILNQVVPLVMIKRLTLSMWGEHSQTHGLPMTILKTDNRDQIGKYQADMQRFIQNRNIVIGTSDQLEMLSQSGNDPHKIYLELIYTCNSEISKAIIGQTMTTDNGSSRSQSEVHERVANEISEADKEYMTYVINDVVFPKLISLGYKLENSTFKYISKEKRSYEEKLETIKNLVKENGYTIDPDDVKAYLDLPFSLSHTQSEQNTVQKKSPVQNELKNELVNWYDQQQNSCCSEHHDILNGVDDEIEEFYNRELESIIDDIINDVYSTNVDVLDPAYIQRVGDLMTSAIYKAFDFNGDYENPNIDADDLEFIKVLRKNTYYFVGGKNKLLKESFTELLFDGDNLKPFNRFKADCKKIGLEYNKNYLKTEYQTAIANAQSASDWQSFEFDDVLRYDAVMDGRTRPEHAKLHGLELPKSDPIWGTIAPQNSWNCRCRLIVVPNGKGMKITNKQRSEYKKLVDGDFKFNSGITGDLFPPNHPYIKALSKEEKQRIEAIL